MIIKPSAAIRQDYNGIASLCTAGMMVSTAALGLVAASVLLMERVNRFEF